MRPIFNKKVVENCNLWDLWTVHVCTVHSWQNQLLRAEPKKKRREKRRGETQTLVSLQSKRALYTYMCDFMKVGV